MPTPFALRRALAVSSLSLASLTSACSSTPAETVTPPVADLPAIHLETCAGRTDLCDRRYTEMTFAATHNAFSYANGGPVVYLAPSQDKPVSAQLAYGIRGLGIRPSPYFGTDATQTDVVYVTHNTDLKGWLGQEPLVDVLTEVKTFLDANPDEIITLFAESDVTPAQVAGAFGDAGLLPYLYTHDATKGWPTLREMIHANTRVVMFNDATDPSRPAWQLSMWDFIVDTDYNITDAAQFSCTPYRGKPTNDLYFLNQFIYEDLGDGIVGPSPDQALIANQPDFVLSRALGCWQTQQRRPNFVYVDWYGKGDVGKAVKALVDRTTAPAP